MFDLKAMSAKSVWGTLLGFLLSFALGTYIGYRHIPHPHGQEKRLITALQEEHSKAIQLIHKRFDAQKQVEKALALIVQKKKAANEKRILPIRGFFAKERNESLLLLQESYYMLLTLEETAMIVLLQTLKAMKIFRTTLTRAIEMIMWAILPLSVLLLLQHFATHKE